MRRYWLMDQFEIEGPVALIETDGSMHVIGVQRFGPGITELADQQQIWDAVVGRIAPTLKPLVDAGKIDESGAEPHADIRWTGLTDGGALRGRGQRGGNSRPGGGRVSGGPSRNRSRGDR